MHIFSLNPPQLADYGIIHILAIWISLYIPCLFWDHVNQTSWYVWKLGSFLSINQSSCSSEVIPAFLNFVLVAICIPIFSRVDKRAWANACSPVDTFGYNIQQSFDSKKESHIPNSSSFAAKVNSTFFMLISLKQLAFWRISPRCSPMTGSQPFLTIISKNIEFTKDWACPWLLKCPVCLP